MLNIYLFKTQYIYLKIQIILFELKQLNSSINC